MRIYRRADFLSLPAGTIFCKGKPWYFGSLHVKGDSLENDFCARDLCWINSDSGDGERDSGTDFGALDEMLEEGTSYPIEDCEGRDGCFNDDDLFLVYEADDLRALMRDIENALTITETGGERSSTG